MAQAQRLPKRAPAVSKPVKDPQADQPYMPMSYYNEPIIATVESGRVGTYDPRSERIWNLAKEMLLKKVGQSTPLSVAGIREIAAQATQLHDEVYASPF